MPDLDRAAIRARLDAATKGRWSAQYPAGDADAALVAHAPKDLAALLDENERLRKALEEIETHHVAQNAAKGRDEGRSTTLRIARAALAGREGV